MKTNILHLFSKFAIVLLIMTGCKKEEKTILPQLTSTALSNISGTNALSGGNITSDGGAPITVRGVCWAISESPTIASLKTSDGIGSGTFSSTISGLTEGTTYHVRAYATNSVGTAYGEDLMFSTISRPILTTTIVAGTTLTTSTSGGNISSDGGSPVTARGICWSTSENPTIDNSKTSDGVGPGTFSSNISGLSKNTTYYVRAYATSSAGTAYGNQVNFTTNTTDVDGNEYHTITIGTQVWLLENLKTIHYRNGVAISHVEDGPTWWALTTEAYCEYGDPAVYGRLYNWYAVTDNRNICPVGYHIPSNVEWQTLIDYLGGATVAGGKLKEAGLSHWTDPNLGATNSSGFTALPAGYRHGGSSDPNYDYKANLTWTSVFWTSTPNLSNGRTNTWQINYSQNNALNLDNTYKGNGLSIRCIRD